jgi:hypothetical protein
MRSLRSFLPLLALIALAALTGPWALAAQYKGYPKSVVASPLVFTESIDRVKETRTEFLILFSHHQAFYAFPKIKDHELDLKDFFHARIKSGEKVMATIDPEKAQILLLQDSSHK